MNWAVSDLSNTVLETGRCWRGAFKILKESDFRGRNLHPPNSQSSVRVEERHFKHVRPQTIYLPSNLIRKLPEICSNRTRTKKNLEPQNREHSPGGGLGVPGEGEGEGETEATEKGCGRVGRGWVL